MNKAIKKITISEGIFLLAVVGILMILLSQNSVKIVATTTQTEYNNNSRFYGYDMDNVLPFREWLEGKGFDFGNLDDLLEVGEKILCFYSEAMELEIISPLYNDILLNGVQGFDPFWLSGSENNQTNITWNSRTHQRLTRIAYDHVAELFPALFTNNGANNLTNPRNALTWYVDWPDFHETGFMNNFHFYYYPTGTNFFHNSVVFGGSNNARNRFVHWYNTAVSRYSSGNKLGAFNALGKALHFIQDLAAPVHTAQRVPPAAFTAVALLGPLGGGAILAIVGVDMYNNHKLFEEVVDANFDSILSGHTISTTLAVQSPNNLAGHVAGFSHARYNPNFNTATSIAVGQETLPMALNASVGVLVRFARDVGSGGFEVSQNFYGHTIRASGTFGGEIIIPEIIHGIPVTQIAANGFSNQTQLTQISIPPTVTMIEPYAFPQGVHIALTEGRTHLQGGLFRRQVQISQITIPKTITSFGGRVFEGWIVSQRIIFEDRYEPEPSWGNWNGGNAGITWLYRGMEIRHGFLTRYTGSGGHVNIPNTVIAIVPNVFRDRQDITKVTIPDSVISIEWGVFYGTGMHIDTEIGNIVYVDNWAVGVRGSLFGSHLLPPNTRGFANGVFSGQSNLEEIVVPSHISLFQEHTNFHRNTRVVWTDNYIFRGSEFLKFLRNSETFRVPVYVGGNVITSIAPYAFANNTTLTSVFIPRSITDIGNRAFMNNFNLQAVVFERGSQLTQIRTQVFYNAANLRSISIPEGITHIGYRAFLGTHNLEAVWLPSTLQVIGQRAFQGAHNLQQISLPYGLEEIWSNAFRSNYSLQHLEIPASVFNVGIDAFYRCYSLSITWHFNPRVTPSHARQFAHRVTSLIIPNGAAVLPEDIIQNASSLISLSLPSSITSLEEGIIPSNVSVSWALLQVDNGTILSVNGALNGVVALPSILEGIPLTAIANSAFSNQTALTKISIPKAVQNIGGWVFSGANSLEEIHITLPSAPDSWHTEWLWGTSARVYFNDVLAWDGEAVDHLIDSTPQIISLEHNADEPQNLFFNVVSYALFRLEGCLQTVMYIFDWGNNEVYRLEGKGSVAIKNIAVCGCCVFAEDGDIIAHHIRILLIVPENTSASLTVFPRSFHKVLVGEACFENQVAIVEGANHSEYTAVELTLLDDAQVSFTKRILQSGSEAWLGFYIFDAQSLEFIAPYSTDIFFLQAGTHLLTFKSVHTFFGYRTVELHLEITREA